MKRVIKFFTFSFIPLFYLWLSKFTVEKLLSIPMNDMFLKNLLIVSFALGYGVITFILYEYWEDLK